MPKGYMIFTENVHDDDTMGTYVQQAIPTILAAGGRILVGAPPDSVLEGSWHGTQTIVLEFATSEAARAWYDSDEYGSIIHLRQAAADTNAVIVTGFETADA